MKKLLLALALMAATAGAQQFPAASSGGGAGYDGGSVTNPFLAPDGTMALPGFAWASETDSGWWRAGSYNSWFVLDELEVLGMTRASGLLETTTVSFHHLGNLQASFTLGTGIPSDSNVFTLNTPTAALEGPGLAVSITASQSSMTLGSGSVGDTSVLTLNGGQLSYTQPGSPTYFLILNKPTLTATRTITFPDNSGTLVLDQSPTTAAYTSTADTIVIDADVDADSDGTITLTVDNAANQMVMSNTGIAFEVEGLTPLALPEESGELEAHQSGKSTLTESSATDILSFPLADGLFIAGTISTVTTCDDTTNIVKQHDTSDFICSNVSDTESCTFGSNLGVALTHNDGSGTFSVHTLAVSTAGTNTVTMTLNSTCSLTQTLFETDWEIEFHQPDWAVVTEQN